MADGGDLQSVNSLIPIDHASSMAVPSAVMELSSSEPDVKVFEDEAELFAMTAFLYCSNLSYPGVDVQNVTVGKVDDWTPLLRCLLGPSRLPMTTLAPITVVYGILLVTGVVGNLFTCFVIAKKRYMHNATNFYLLNLSIADMFSSCIAMPLELLTLWQQYPWIFGERMCQLRGVITEAPAYVSVLTISAFTVERFMAISSPLSTNYHFDSRTKLSRANRIIIAIWIVSFVGASPWGIYHTVNHLEDLDGNKIRDSAWCGIPFNRPSKVWMVLFSVYTLVFFCIPFGLIMVLYGRMGFILHESCKMTRRNLSAGASVDATPCTSWVRFERSQTRRPSTWTSRVPGPPERAQMKGRKSVIKMLFAIVIGFFVCWAPFHAQRLLFVYVTLFSTWTEKLKTVNEYLFTTAGVLYYVNSTLNPLIYSVMSSRFRRAFKDVLSEFNDLRCMNCCSSSHHSSSHHQNPTVSAREQLKETERRYQQFRTRAEQQQNSQHGNGVVRNGSASIKEGGSLSSSSTAKNKARNGGMAPVGELADIPNDRSSTGKEFSLPAVHSEPGCLLEATSGHTSRTAQRHQQPHPWQLLSFCLLFAPKNEPETPKYRFVFKKNGSTLGFANGDNFGIEYHNSGCYQNDDHPRRTHHCCRNGGHHCRHVDHRCHHHHQQQLEMNRCATRASVAAPTTIFLENDHDGGGQMRKYASCEWH